MNKSLISSIILLFVLLIPACFSLFGSSFFTFHDETQIANMYAYRDTLDHGQFPPRWTTEMSYRYGSPLPQFNYQLPYYLDYGFAKFGVSLIMSFKYLLVLSIFLGALSSLWFARLWTHPAIALAIAVIYSYVPYRSVNIYVRGSLGESFALALAPFIFVGLTYLLKNKTRLGVIITSLATAALLITHQPTSIVLLPLIYGCFFLYSLIYQRVTLIPLIASGLIALALSAYYWLPVILEQRYLVLTSPFNFYDHFPFIKQLLNGSWGYGGSEWGPNDQMSFALGIPTLITLVLVLGLTVYSFIKRQFKQIVLPLLFIFAVGFGLFLMNVRSSFLWEIFPYTQLIQFPWRLLVIPTVFVPLSLALIPVSAKSKLPFVALALAALSVLMNQGMFRPGEVVTRTDDYFLRRFLPTAALHPGETISPEYLNHSEDYLPQPKYSTRPTVLSELLTSDLNSTIIYSLDSNPFALKMRLESLNSDRITFHQYYFPGWIIKLDNQIITPKLDSHGAQSFLVSKGEHQLDISFVDTPVRFFGNMTSLVAIIILVLLALKRPHVQHS